MIGRCMGIFLMPRMILGPSQSPGGKDGRNVKLIFHLHPVIINLDL
jgi:hypothetical protein